MPTKLTATAVRSPVNDAVTQTKVLPVALAYTDFSQKTPPLFIQAAKWLGHGVSESNMWLGLENEDF